MFLGDYRDWPLTIECHVEWLEPLENALKSEEMRDHGKFGL